MANPIITSPETDETRLSTADLVAARTVTVSTEKTADTSEGHTALFVNDEAERFRNRWHDIQGEFADEPRRSVQRADELAASVIKRLAEVFADERSKLERNWSSGENVSTEDLRQALRRYRSFFDRLLSV